MDAGLPPVLMRHMPHSQAGMSDKDQGKAAAEVGGRPCKAGLGQAPRRKKSIRHSGPGERKEKKFVGKN